ncbi:MAG: spondin domain-containing protein [Mariniblastus sp.]
MRIFIAAMFVAMVSTVGPVQAQQQVELTIENLQPNDGFFLTPVWAGFHNGGFDFFDAGAAASTSLENLAEGGDVSGLVNDFAAFGSGQDGVLANPGGFGGAPVIDPGESVSMVFNLDATERYLSFASMVIPSNDGFFGNDDAMGIEVLDAGGNFVFGSPLEFTFAELWDSGTELNDGQGAAFSANGGTSTDTTDAIALHAGLGNFDGTGTAAGTTINFGNASASPAFRLTIAAVPEPNSLVVVGLLGMVGLARRNRKS